MSLKRKLAFTFDDGMLSNYEFTAKVLKEHGFSATFFVTGASRLWDGTELEEPQISWTQLKEMSDDGFEIGNHTYFHSSISDCTEEELLHSVQFMELEITRRDIPKPVTFSYPTFRCNEISKKVMRTLGYKYARCGYKPNEPNKFNFHGNLACNPLDRNEVSYYIPEVTDCHMIFVTGIINGNIRNACYDSELFIKDLEGTPEGAVPVFAGHGMPTEVRQKAFVEMVEYCVKNDWHPVALKDI